MRQPLPEASAVDVRRPRKSPARLAALRRVAADEKRPLIRLLAEWLELFLAQRLSIGEYLGLRLFDDGFYGAADKRAFVGNRGAGRILLKANYRLDLFGLIDNKIACDFLLAAHGLPIVPTVALYRGGAGRPAPFLLHSEAELRAFLSDAARYPLFGKPLGGTQSLGSASFDRYDAGSDAVVSFDGRALALDAFMREIAAHYATGYIFQRRVSPAPEMRAICGDRLATVRVLTAMGRDGPHILRAAWKIPAGRNAADNFWRVGNLLARIGLDSGRIESAVRATSTAFEEATHHPDTGAALRGTVVPHWRELLDLALDGARVIGELGLLGWDIAPAESGAVIVEVNQIPDFRLHQIADRRGMLDPAMLAFLRERQALQSEWRRKQLAR